MQWAAPLAPVQTDSSVIMLSQNQEPELSPASSQVTILHTLGVEGGPKVDSKDLLSLASFCSLLLFHP